jgi:hypothetical protein
MASFTFVVPNEHFERLVDAVCGLQNYKWETRETEETKNQFAKRKIREWLVAQVRRWEQAEAQKAVTAALTDINVT